MQCAGGQNGTPGAVELFAVGGAIPGSQQECAELCAAEGVRGCCFSKMGSHEEIQSCKWKAGYGIGSAGSSTKYAFEMEGVAAVTGTDLIINTGVRTQAISRCF